MLHRLSVENFILIDRLDLELAAGLNTITGETGAGKSILLGALGLLLGSRNEGGAMKDPARNCVVEGVFSVAGYGLEEFFAANDLDHGDQLTIRRVISPGGKSRAYVNDLPVPVAVLKELSSRLIDIHSQHQSLMLASDAFRLSILDSVAGNGALLAQYATVWGELQAARRELAAQKETAAAAAREQEYLQFQYDQLREAGLKEGEQQDLEERQAALAHAEQIGQALSLSGESLSGDEHGALPRLKQAVQALSHISEWFAPAAELSRRVDSAYQELRDVERELSAAAARVDADPTQLQLLDDRLALIYSLLRKHGAESVEELTALREQYSVQLEGITTAGENIAALEKQCAALRERAGGLAAQLGKKRAAAGAQVKKHVESLLAQLGMPGAQLTIEVTAGELGPRGGDQTRFLFSANRSVSPQPVEKVASGGEISRLMLALKSLVAERSMLPTIIFDEIDTGVSGRIADAMGGIIDGIGGRMQVVNITHLPQVASKGDTHFVVYKEDTSGGTVSRIRLLSPDERVAEIAKMLSGSSVTDAAMAQARLLIGERGREKGTREKEKEVPRSVSS
jgi:DNA repair protein RecN (Recombination protein N)